ncbi:MAG: phosphate signaling complex protein PhoU [Promicromonosporaceae bacterium]|nr:phosphate signaling complex protein PhoU [Promicromonosporaceae bacterium]
MRSHLDAELRETEEYLAQMADLVTGALAQAGEALLTTDLDLAQAVIGSDSRLDMMQREVEERCLSLLLLQQPVATDLRVVLSSLRISMTLERMGDLAAHLATVARSRFPAPAIPEAARGVVAGMIEAAVHVSEQVRELLRSRDLDLAAMIERDDDVLDNLRDELYQIVLDSTWAGSAQNTMDITLTGRYLERFGDHGVSISRRIEFLVTGDIYSGESSVTLAGDEVR